VLQIPIGQLVLYWFKITKNHLTISLLPSRVDKAKGRKATPRDDRVLKIQEAQAISFDNISGPVLSATAVLALTNQLEVVTRRKATALAIFGLYDSVPCSDAVHLGAARSAAENARSPTRNHASSESALPTSLLLAARGF
jgi:hypothetical protein